MGTLDTPAGLGVAGGVGNPFARSDIAAWILHGSLAVPVDTRCRCLAKIPQYQNYSGLFSCADFLLCCKARLTGPRPRMRISAANRARSCCPWSDFSFSTYPCGVYTSNWRLLGYSHCYHHHHCQFSRTLAFDPHHSSGFLLLSYSQKWFLALDLSSAYS